MLPNPSRSKALSTRDCGEALCRTRTGDPFLTIASPEGRLERSSSARCSRPTTSTTPPRSPARSTGSKHHYNQLAKPFEWNFTREDLIKLLDSLDTEPTANAPAALAA